MDMDSMTQKNAAMAQQSKSVSQVMQEKSLELSDMIAFFKTDESDQAAPQSRSEKPRVTVLAEARQAAPAAPMLQKKAASAASGYSGAGQHADDDADWKEF